MSLTIQFYTMLSMVAAGTWLGASIDTYRRFARQPRPKWSWMTIFNDFLFWLIQGLLIFYVLLKVNEGEMRFYIFLALICGYAAYQALFQRIYLRSLETCIRASIAIYRFVRALIISIFINPIKWLLKLLYSLVIMVISLILSILMFIFKVIFKPLSWLGKIVYKLSRLDRLVNSIKKSKWVKKAVALWKYIRTRGNKGDD
ncbi:MAG: spore cortex biosynthesis protein YabQ [Bacillaceae bacterium]|nr:spore cortex biosynthesis protein YabQ [Bacillaceae bacterium]